MEEYTGVGLRATVAGSKVYKGLKEVTRKEFLEWLNEPVIQDTWYMSEDSLKEFNRILKEKINK